MLGMYYFHPYLSFSVQFMFPFSSFGQLCVLADQKWKSIFKQCWASLGGNNDTKLVGNEATQRAWENVASALCTSRHASRVHELLHTIPHSGRHNLDLQQYKQIVLYLQQVMSQNKVKKNAEKD